MKYNSSPVGNEIRCVMHKVDKKILLDNKKLKKYLVEALKKDNFTVLKKSEFEFSPQGYTIMFLLAESHIAIHTFPEYNSLVFYLYTCRNADDGKNTFNYFKEKIKPSSIDLIERDVVVKK